MLSNMEATSLGKAIADLVADRGLGAISKKDYDLIVFHHISTALSQQKDGNYALSNKLKIAESRVKTLRLEAALRHDPPDHAKVLKSIIGRVVTQIKGLPSVDGNLVISLENPVEKREFEYAIRRANHPVDYGLNRDLLKISPLALFDVVLANVDNPEPKFKEIVQKLISDKNEQDDVLSKALTFRQKVNKLGEKITSNNGAVALLSAGARLL